MKKSNYTSLTALLLLLVCHTALGQKNTLLTKLMIKPSLTDATIKAADAPHVVLYHTLVEKKKLVLFLPGTNGIPERGPMLFFETAVAQGHQVINLAYITKQAVAGICRGENLEKDRKCTEKFRQKRIFGTDTMSLIPDEPQDAIAHRLQKLLVYLNQNDPKGYWDKYLENGAIKWSQIIVTGQSQGGGMAAFIAKKHKVARIIDFSGGWDYAAKGEIADWYSYESITPAKDWYGTYHTLEPMADDLAKTYKAMHIPADQTYALDLEVQKGKKAHSQAIRNTAYKDIWVKILTMTD